MSNIVRLVSASDVTTRKKQQGTTNRYNAMQQQDILPIGGIPFADLYDIAHTSAIYTDQTTACIPCEGDVNFVLRQYKPIYQCDPNAWLDTPNGKFDVYGYGIAYNGSNLWVAIGYLVPIKYSNDGITWNNASPVSGFSSGHGVAFGGGTWVAVGGSNGYSILTSSDGANWINTVGGFNIVGVGVAYGGGNWVAVGADTNGKTIKYSTDSGANWIDATSGGFATGLDIAYGDGLWVGVGYGSSSIKWSTDGLIWNDSISGAFDVAGNGIAYNNGLWIAAGDDTVAPIKGSTDGKNWFNLLLGGTAKYGVAYGAGRWIVGGVNTIIYSADDGINWHNMTNAFSDIAYYSAYGDGKWITVGRDSGGNTIKVIECPLTLSV